MKHKQFRAVIPEKNAVIYFNLVDMISPKFSNRNILFPWLRAGNRPNQYLGIETKGGGPVYEYDVIETEEYKWLVEEIGTLERDGVNRGLCVSPFGDGNNYFLEDSILAGKIVGNIDANPNLIER